MDTRFSGKPAHRNVRLLVGKVEKEYDAITLRFFFKASSLCLSLSSGCYTLCTAFSYTTAISNQSIFPNPPHIRTPHDFSTASMRLSLKEWRHHRSLVKWFRSLLFHLSKFTSQVSTAFPPSFNLSAMAFGIILQSSSSLLFLSCANFSMFSSKAFPLSNS